jgi:hypothetical protein
MARPRPKPSKPARIAPRFAVGDRVLIKFGPASLVDAEIIEDRGPIGHAQAEIYRVQTINAEPSDPRSFEVRDQDLIAAGVHPNGKSPA